MKLRELRVDLERAVVEGTRDDGSAFSCALDSPEAFEALATAWLRCGWDTKYVYSFTWLGRPIIQLPEDMMRLQEVIYRVKPDVVIETGVAHGGGLVFYASVMQAYGGRRVIGIDIEVRSHNREAIEAHPLASMIDLVEGSSIDPAVVANVSSLLQEGDRVMVILDSNHSRDHVLEELRRYGPFVSAGSYIVACDGIMQDLVGAPRAAEDWGWNNPVRAVHDFLDETNDFVLEEPPFSFNEGVIRKRVTYWPDAFLRRIDPQEKREQQAP